MIEYAGLTLPQAIFVLLQTLVSLSVVCAPLVTLLTLAANAIALPFVLLWIEWVRNDG
jgi:hypothetical protein